MIGLEYILNLYNMQHQELAEKLGIRKQNINLWIKQKQNLSKKHLPKLAEIFKIPQEYFEKELTDVDKLIIQKEKLKNELGDNAGMYQLKADLFDKDHGCSINEEPMYGGEILEMELKILKAKIIEDLNKSENIPEFGLEIIRDIIRYLNHGNDRENGVKDIRKILLKYV